MGLRAELIPYKPIGGINMLDSEDSLGELEVRDARNFLFERQCFKSRPGVVGVAPAGLSGSLIFMKSLIIETSAFTLAITSDNKLWKISTDLSTATEITSGGSVTFPSITAMNAEVINGIICVSGNPGGIVHWPTSGTVYTELSSSDYLYLTSHATRAVGAYKLGGAAGDTRRIGWSRSGDETLWTGGDSGTAHLIDSPDDITGLTVLHNMLVVCRRYGFTLGRLTGGGSPVYEFEIWDREGTGVTYPSTMATFANVLYFVSAGDVHTFDLRQVTSIGGKIREELLHVLKYGPQYQGVVGRMYEAARDQVRLQYHLFPIGIFGNRMDLPHFIYDIESATWSKHHYGFVPRGGFYRKEDFNSEAPALFDATKVYTWDPDVPCEADMQLVSRTFTLGPEDTELTLRRVLAKYRNFGPQRIEITARCMQDDNVVENSHSDSIGTTPIDGKLRRAWFPMEGITGQDFEVQLDVAAGQKYEGNLLGLEVGTGGEFLGAERE